MKKIKKLISVVLLGSLVGTFISCGSSSDATVDGGSKEKYKVAYTTMDLGSPYFAEVAKGVEAKAKELGWDVQIHDAKGEVGNQISALENFITQGVDAILISPLEENAAKSTIAKAKEKGIKVISMNSPIEGADVFVTPDEYDMGYTIGKAAGEWAKKNLAGEKVKVVTYYVQEHPATVTRQKGMKEAILELVPDAEFIASLSALTPEDGINNMEGLIQSNPDINIVIGCNDAGIMGSYQVAKAANMNLDKMYFGGIDAVSQALDLIKSEKESGKGAYRGTVDITPHQTGIVSVEAAEKLLKEQQVDKKIIIPSKIVNWDNIESYF